MKILKQNWFRILIVILFASFLVSNINLQKRDNFSKKQECSKYYELANTKIKESGRDFQNDTYTVNEIFYSPQMNTCLYAYTIHTNTDPKVIYTIDDIFGGSVFVGGISQTAEADFYKKITELKNKIK